MKKKFMSLVICEDLYNVIAKEADKRSIPMSEVMVVAIASHFGRPSLGYVPRDRLGRPRTKGK